jgi:hypothetical protein
MSFTARATARLRDAVGLYSSTQITARSPWPAGGSDSTGSHGYRVVSNPGPYFHKYHSLVYVYYTHQHYT